MKPPPSPPRRAIRGRLLSFKADPRLHGAAAYTYVEDGLVLVEGGLIRAVGEAAPLLKTLPVGTPVDHFPGKLVLPGFIDTHLHFPQTRVIASYGAQLLEWLHKYTFVEEQKFGDSAHAAAAAKFFFDELLANGTTTAAVYGSVHPQSIEAFFIESERRSTRMIAGKVMMDTNAPEALRDTPQLSYDDSRALLLKWHGRGRQLYAITPRFAITSTAAQLEAAGALAREFPQAYVQTHLCENHAEIALARSLYPERSGYTDIYRHYGLLGAKTLLGHCLHLAEDEVDMLANSGSVAVFCPTSNLFLGSGLFNRARLLGHAVRIGLATDIGGGTSYSMLVTASEAYKVLQLQGQTWPAVEAFWQMTLGNAQALGLADKIGKLEAGMEADIIVLNASATPAMAHRMESVDGDLAGELFVLMMLGDERAVERVYLGGG